MNRHEQMAQCLARQALVYNAVMNAKFRSVKTGGVVFCREGMTEYEIRRDERVNHVYRKQWHNNGVRRTLRQLEKKGLIRRVGSKSPYNWREEKRGREHVRFKVR